MGIRAYTPESLSEAGFFETVVAAQAALRRGTIRGHKLGRRWIVLEDQLLEDLRDPDTVKVPPETAGAEAS